MSRINRVSKLFQPFSIPPKDAPKSEDKYVTSSVHMLMISTGIIRHSNTGIYHLLPLGLRAMKKLEKLVGSHMERIDAQELKFPLIVDAELWKKSGRWHTSNEEVFKFHDRHKNDFFLSPTNEESAAHLVSGLPTLNAKQFPLLIYQNNFKFRDEMKPRCGLIRGREFLMKDLYSFDINMKDAETTYELVSETYKKIFSELNLDFIRVKADPGDIGGHLSHEFHIRCSVGEDLIRYCNTCGRSEIKGDSEIQCNTCKNDSFEEIAGLEVGHTFLLGTKYTEPLGAKYMTQTGQMEPLVMGSYGLGLTRILAGSLDINSKTEEIRWPHSIAPYKLIIISPKKGSKEENLISELPLEIYQLLDHLPNLQDDVILDDSTSFTIGKRIIHAKRTGYPYIIVVGNKATLDPPLFELIDVYNDKIIYLSVQQLLSFFDVK